MEPLITCHDKHKRHCNNNWFKYLAILIPLLFLIIFMVVVVIISNPGPPEPGNQLVGLQVQLTDETLIIEDESPIVFNSLVNDVTDAVSYDSATGLFTITEPGNYYIDWWVAADGSPIAVTIDLSIVTSNGIVIAASSPILSGQISGNALISVVAAPITFRLINTTGNEIFIGSTTVKANLTILNLDSI